MTTEVATPQAVSGKEYQLLINGKWVPSKSGETLERRYPANTDVVVATFPAATEQDVDEAIAAARAAFDNPSGGRTFRRASAQTSCARPRRSSATRRRSSRRFWPRKSASR